MLISGGMEYDLGMVKLKDHTETLDYTNVTDHRHEVYTGIFLLELQTDVVEGALGGIEQDEFAHTDPRQLPAELAADTAGSTGDKDGLIAIFRCDLTHVDLDLLTSQKVLDTDGTDKLVEKTVDIRLADGRGNQSLHANALAIFEKAVLLFLYGVVTGKKYALDTVLFNQLLKIGLVGERIDTGIGKDPAAVIGTVNTKTGDPVMGAVAKTGLQGNALVIRTVDKHTHVALTDHTDQGLIGDDDDDPETDQGDQGEHTVGDDEYQVLAAE